MPLYTVQNLKNISLARDVFLKYWETTLKTLGKHWELANKTLGLTPGQPVATLKSPQTVYIARRSSRATLVKMCNKSYHWIETVQVTEYNITNKHFNTLIMNKSCMGALIR